MGSEMCIRDRAYSVYCTASDCILFNKVLDFFSNLEELELEQVEEFRRELDHDAKKSKRISQQLLLHIDKLDSLSKPQALARCFSHFLTFDISYSQYLDLAAAVINVTPSDLEALTERPYKLGGSTRNGRLLGCGLVEVGIPETYEDNETPEIGFRISPLGVALSRILNNSFREHRRKRKEQSAELLQEMGGVYPEFEPF